MRVLIPRRWFALALCCLAILVACGGGGGGGSSSNTPAPALADFSLQVAPGSLQIPAGGSGYLTITLSRLNGFTSAVSVSGVAFPAGVVLNGSVPAGSITVQLPVSVAPGVMPLAYSGLSLRGQAGTISHDAAFSLTVAPPLPPSHLRDDLVQAAGGRQTGGAIENLPVVGEAVPAQTVRDANDTTRLRQGFYPNGLPID